MPKFSDVDEGYAARKRGVTFTSLAGKQCICDLRVVTGEDDDEIMKRAAAHAVSKGQPATPGTPLYDFACACELVAIAAIDPASPDEAPTPYFSSVDQIRKRLDRDRINYLAEQQNEFQASVCPLKRSLSKDEYFELVTKVAAWKEGTDSPFVGLGPSLVLSFAHTLASQHIALLMSRSPDSPPTSSPESSDTSASPSSSSDTDLPSS